MLFKHAKLQKNYDTPSEHLDFYGKYLMADSNIALAIYEKIRTFVSWKILRPCSGLFSYQASVWAWSGITIRALTLVPTFSAISTA